MYVVPAVNPKEYPAAVLCAVTGLGAYVCVGGGGGAPVITQTHRQTPPPLPSPLKTSGIDESILT